jgi:hypothetical protein
MLIPHVYSSHLYLIRTFILTNMSVPPPYFQGGGFDADWVKSVLVKNNWKDYYGKSWSPVAANIEKLAHYDPPLPLPSADAGVYEVRLWLWKVLTMEKYALYDHPAQLLSISLCLTYTGDMLRGVSSKFWFWSAIDSRNVTSVSRELASNAIWEWIEKGKIHENKWDWMYPFKLVFGQSEDKGKERKDAKCYRSGPDPVERAKRNEDVEDGSKELLPTYNKY